MKIDKRIAKCIIAATVVIAIVATAPVLSGVSVAQALQHVADLRIENVISANCLVKVPLDGTISIPAQYCPQGTKHGLTTITYSGCGITYPKVEFPAGPWGVVTKKVIRMEMWSKTDHCFPKVGPIETHYEITTTVPEPHYTFADISIPGIGKVGLSFTHKDTFIAGPCSGHFKCGPTMMGAGGADVKVVYYWSINAYIGKKPM